VQQGVVHDQVERSEEPALSTWPLSPYHIVAQ
jgi:hypothetical protein